MPDASFAAGLLSGYLKTTQAEQARKDKNSLEAAQFLMNSGRVRDFKDLVPFLGPLLEPTGGKKGKGKGGMEPSQLLAQMINPALKNSYGQGQPQGGPQGGAAPQSPFLSEDEAQQKATEAKVNEARQISQEVRIPEIQEQERLRAINREPKEGSLEADLIDAERAFAHEKGHPPTYPERLEIAKKVREERSKPPSFVTTLDPKTRPFVDQLLEDQKIIPSQATQAQVEAVLPIASRMAKAVEDRAARKEAAEDRERGLRTRKLEKELADEGATTSIKVSPDPPDPLTGDVTDPATGWTPNAVYEMSKTWAITGRPPTLGLGSKAKIDMKRSLIANVGSAMLRKAGTSQVALMNEYKGVTKATSTLIDNYTQTSVASETAAKNLDLARQQRETTIGLDSNFRLVNRFQAWKKQQIGDADISALELYIYTAGREYGKVVTGAARSVAGITVSASDRVDQLLSSVQSPKAFNAVILGMQKDMDNVTSTMQGKIKGESKVIADFLEIPQSAPSAPPPGPVADPLGVLGR